MRKLAKIPIKSRITPSTSNTTAMRNIRKQFPMHLIASILDRSQPLQACITASCFILYTWAEAAHLWRETPRLKVEINNVFTQVHSVYTQNKHTRMHTSFLLVFHTEKSNILNSPVHNNNSHFRELFTVGALWNIRKTPYEEALSQVEQTSATWWGDRGSRYSRQVSFLIFIDI